MTTVKDLVDHASGVNRREYDWAWVAVILQYELGGACRQLSYAENTCDDDLARARLADALVELSDLVTQVRCLHQLVLEWAQREGVSFRPTWDELVEVGAERMLARLDEVEAGKV